MRWCVDEIANVLREPQPSSWIARWLQTLKQQPEAFHPHVPPYGFGDAASYRVVEKAVEHVGDSGAVRHGPECFNYYFPQAMDDLYLVIWNGFASSSERSQTRSAAQGAVGRLLRGLSELGSAGHVH